MSTRRIELNVMAEAIEGKGPETTVVGSEHTGLTEYIKGTEEGAVTLFRAKVNIARTILGDGLPEISAWEIGGLSITGVRRRGSLLVRRFAEASIEEIQRGDRVILEDEAGDRHTTLPIKILHPRNT